MHQSAFSCGVTIRRELESATQSRSIRDELRERYARDARIANRRQTLTYDTNCRLIDAKRQYLRLKVDYFDNQSCVLTITRENTLPTCL